MPHYQCSQSSRLGIFKKLAAKREASSFAPCEIWDMIWDMICEEHIIFPGDLGARASRYLFMCMRSCVLVHTYNNTLQRCGIPRPDLKLVNHDYCFHSTSDAGSLSLALCILHCAFCILHLSICNKYSVNLELQNCCSLEEQRAMRWHSSYRRLYCDMIDVEVILTQEVDA